MSRKVIGDKTVFAIEYAVSDTNTYVMGNFCLWIKSLQLGCLDESVMLFGAAEMLTELFSEDKNNKDTHLKESNLKEIGLRKLKQSC